MTTSTTYLDKLKQTDNEPLLFATSKTSKMIIREDEGLLQAMVKERNNRELIFHFDTNLRNTTDEMDSFGRLEDGCTVKEYKATLQNTVNITQSNESDTVVYDMCLIDSGDLLLADFNNRKLKRFNSALQYKDSILLSNYPIAVCMIDEHQVAVRLDYSKVVQFVSVGQSMQLTSSFTLADNGYGMTYDAGSGEIFACEGNKVSVYSVTGNKLRTYNKDTNGEPLFLTCKHIVLSKDKNDIYVSDCKTGLTVIGKYGHLKMKVSLSGFNNAWPLCILPGHFCLIGSQTSGVIVQVDKDGNQIGTLIDAKDGRSYTYCATYDHAHSTLFIGGQPGVVNVYIVSPKRKSITRKHIIHANVE